MKVVEPTEADKATLREVLRSVIIPRWVQRCGTAACGVEFNEAIAPIIGFKYEAK